LIEGLIVEEERSKGRVKFSTYSTYIQFAGGCWFILIALLVMLLFTILGIGSQLWVKYWTGLPVLKKDPMWYVWIYSSLALSYGVFSGIRAFVLCRSNIKGIAVLHETMMRRLLNAPINKFF